jgi:murein DD-endopeptidase MepM/ murein hydrolase activator NlpD
MVIRKHRRAFMRALLLGCALCVPVFGWPATASATEAFVSPLPPPLTVVRSFAVPAQPWLAGNRGVDLAASPGEPVFAVVSGWVLYAGEVAGRGVISIVSSEQAGVRTTYEPVDPVVRVGEAVTAGEVIGHVADVADDCGPPGTCLHWGVLRGQTYVDPMGLLGSGRVRLLPIWPAAVEDVLRLSDLLTDRGARCVC